MIKIIDLSSTEDVFLNNIRSKLIEIVSNNFIHEHINPDCEFEYDIKNNDKLYNEIHLILNYLELRIDISEKKLVKDFTQYKDIEEKLDKDIKEIQRYIVNENKQTRDNLSRMLANQLTVISTGINERLQKLEEKILGAS